MLAKPKIKNQSSFFFTLEDTLNQKHPLYILSNKVHWQLFENEFSPLYCEDNGRPAKSIRLMVGLLILKHIRNISDESIVEQWAENLYYQYFCGQQEFSSMEPCEASELVHFRKRIGESGIELILKESIRINGNDSNDDQVSVDTTVQEKNITYPTDAKLHKKIIKKCLAIAKKEQLSVRQTYTRTLKKLGVDQRFRNHPRNKSKAKKADKKVRTIAGRLVRELERNLKPDSIYLTDIELFKRVLAQKRTSKNKIYSLHEPETLCFSKGKAPKKAAVDRGYRGRKQIGETQIQLPKPFNNKTQTKYQQKKLKEAHKKRAAIEPVIGHLKTDHRIGRNFYKGIVGDNINIMLAATAFNFKRMMNKWKLSYCHFFQELYSLLEFMIYKIFSLKRAF